MRAPTPFTDFGDGTKVDAVGPIDAATMAAFAGRGYRFSARVLTLKAAPMDLGQERTVDEDSGNPASAEGSQG
jgi:hypothetical protein